MNHQTDLEPAVSIAPATDTGDRDEHARWGEILTLVTEWIGEHTGNSRVTYADAIGYPRNPTNGQPRDTSTVRNGVAWLPWCAHQRLHPFAAKRVHVLAWIDDLARTPHPNSGKLLGKSTRAQMVSAVSSFYTWATQEGHLEANPVQINRRKLKLSTASDASPTRSLTISEVDALQHAADNDRLARYRDRSSAIVAVLFDVGLRVSELVGLTLDEMGVMQGTRVLWLTLKGGRRHVVELPADAADRVDTYLAGRNDLDLLPAVHGQPGDASPPLFATDNGKPMYRSQVNNLLIRLSKQAGLSDPNSIHPHVARHSFITTARAQGATESDIQEHVGHVDPKTTGRYGKHSIRVSNALASKVAQAYRNEGNA